MPTNTDFGGSDAQPYLQQVRTAYLEIIKEVSKLTNKGLKPTSTYFQQNTAVNKKVNKLMEVLHQNILGITTTGINSEWERAVENNNKIANAVFGKDLSKLPAHYKSKYLTNNDKAREAFIQRKTNGLNISDRVWNYTDQFKQEIELALEHSIYNGKSAYITAKDMQQYLTEPDKLFRRIKDDKGVLRLSQAAKAYHPGQGVYRSSYKNSLRLVANETNFAYESSNREKRMQQDFVVGVEIRVSPGHSPALDTGGISCTALQGFYPKNFDWSMKWHCNCKCMSLHVLKTQEEVDEDMNRILEGKEPLQTSTNSVNGLPSNYSTYVKENADMWKNWQSKPNWIENNKGLKLDTSKLSKIRKETEAKYNTEEILDKFDYNYYDSRKGTLQGYIGELQGFNDLPQKVTSAEYEKTLQNPNYIKTYRGLKGETAKQYINEYKDGVLFEGVGIYGDGTYTTTRYQSVLQYADGNETHIIEAAFDKTNVKIADFNDLQEVWVSERAEKGANLDNLRKHFGESYKETTFEVRTAQMEKMSIYDNFGSWATSKGYDIISINQGSGEYYYVILNRTKLIVQ